MYISLYRSSLCRSRLHLWWDGGGQGGKGSRGGGGQDGRGSRGAGAQGGRWVGVKDCGVKVVGVGIDRFIL